MVHGVLNTEAGQLKKKSKQVMGILKLIHVFSRNGYFETHLCLYFETPNPNPNSICQTLKPKSTKSPNNYKGRNFPLKEKREN